MTDLAKGDLSFWWTVRDTLQTFYLMAQQIPENIMLCRCAVLCLEETKAKKPQSMHGPNNIINRIITSTRNKSVYQEELELIPEEKGPGNFRIWHFIHLLSNILHSCWGIRRKIRNVHFYFYNCIWRPCAVVRMSNVICFWRMTCIIDFNIFRRERSAVVLFKVHYVEFVKPSIFVI